MFNNGFSGVLPVTEVGGNNNNSWGADGGWWWIWVVLLFFCGGWGNNGWGGNGNAATQGALTRGDLCMDMNFQDLQNGVRNVNDAVALGFANLNSTICNQQYDTAGMINAMNISNLQGFNALQAQLAQCCCDNRAAIAEVNYNMATNTCAITNQIQNSTRDIIDAQNAGTQAILGQMCNDKIATLESELAQARLLASQSAQNQDLIEALAPKAPAPAFVVPNPFTGQFGSYGYGYGNCGCNTGCC